MHWALAILGSPAHGKSLGSARGLKMDLQQALHHPSVTLVQGVISGAGKGFSVPLRSFLTARAKKKQTKNTNFVFHSIFFLNFKKLFFNWRIIALQYHIGFCRPSA